ncbi:MAG: hypothetical protein QY307_02455 [Acidimicrobiia bacterium]|nr:MAG: hypothetical protein QY307_02455 [Acidimicrobiia bacterium]
MTKTIRVILGAALALLLGAGPAAATAWGPIDSWYNGHRVVKAWGDAGHGSTSWNNFYLQDPINDGNTVYAKTRFYSSWYPYSLLYQRTTPEIENTTRYFSHTAPGSYYTIKTIACAEMGWPVPDSCSSWVIIP